MGVVSARVDVSFLQEHKKFVFMNSDSVFIFERVPSDSFLSQIPTSPPRGPRRRLRPLSPPTRCSTRSARSSTRTSRRTRSWAPAPSPSGWTWAGRPGSRGPAICRFTGVTSAARCSRAGRFTRSTARALIGPTLCSGSTTSGFRLTAFVAASVRRVSPGRGL